MSESSERPGNGGPVEHLNPEALIKNPALTNVVVVMGNAKTVYIGGLDAVDAAGTIVALGDIVAQTEQVFRNLEAALEAAGAGLEHVIKWNIFVVQGQPVREGFQVFQRVWSRRPHPPAITMVFVAGLAHPDVLVELDVVAVVPQ